MKEFSLNDGQKATIHIWNFSQLKKYVNKAFPTSTTRSQEHFERFRYFGPTVVSELNWFDKEIKYSDEKELSPLEIQAERDLPNEQYHRSLVAMIDDNLCGIIVCPWIKDNFSFWKYRIMFIDINKNLRNQGIGTNLIKSLDQAEFLNSKVLQEGIYSYEGNAYIKKIIHKELKGERYAFIPSNYFFKIPPKKIGVYDKSGKLKT